MTDNEIIKALECCGEFHNKRDCLKCPYYNIKIACSIELKNDALNLINRQKAEIERLKDENYHLRGYSDSVVKRMQYLFQSDTIRQFDEIDRHTHQYKKDVTKFDEEFKRYKEAFEKMSEEKVFSVYLDIHSIKAEAVKEFAERLCKDRVSNDTVVIAVKVELKTAGEENGEI